MCQVLTLGRRCCRLLLPLLVAAAGAEAQTPGGPTGDITAASPRFGLRADFTRGELLPATGVVRTWGGTGVVTVGGSVALSAGAAILDADSAESGWSAHAAVSPEVCAAFRPASIDGRFHFCDLLPGLLALRLRAGVTHAAFELAGGSARTTEATLGAAVAFQAPIPLLTAELWLAPRLHLLAANAAATGGADGAVRMGGGATLGVAVTLTSGLGLHVAIDELWIERVPEDGASGRFAVGVGLHYTH